MVTDCVVQRTTFARNTFGIAIVQYTTSDQLLCVVYPVPV